MAAQPAAAPSTNPATAELGRGFSAYRSGDYHAAARTLRGVVGKGLRAEDWALFLLAESEFYDGNYRAARERFDKLGRGRGRPAQMAPFRAADCLWMEGDRAKAAAAYTRLVKTATARSGDVALARFRIAEQTSDRDREAARKLFLAIARDFPSHPLADEAIRRIAGGTASPASAAAAAPDAPKPPPPPPAQDLSPADRLRRAESLSKDRHWDEAL